MKNETGVPRDTKVCGADEAKTSESKDRADSSISEKPKRITRGGIGSRLDEL